MNKNLRIVSLILARGNSKGIVNKNITNLCGKPLIAHAIEASLKSDVHETWVSTDSREITEIAIKYGANVIKRPDELAKDTSPSEDALLHFLENNLFDVLVFIQPTSPLIKAEYINEGIFKMQEYDSVFSVCKEHWVPRWNLDITPDNWNPKFRPRRQDMPEKYIENGAFYITTRDVLCREKNRYGGRLGVVEMPYMHSFQVDTYEDLELIRKIIEIN